VAVCKKNAGHKKIFPEVCGGTYAQNDSNPDGFSNYFVPEMQTECITVTPEDFLNYYPEVAGLAVVLRCEEA
jgi:hypothetical protein